jgi:hypothetical protein
MPKPTGRQQRQEVAVAVKDPGQRDRVGGGASKAEQAAEDRGEIIGPVLKAMSSPDESKPAADVA